MKKYVAGLSLVFIASFSDAQVDLETQDNFFSKDAQVEDDLDRAYRKGEFNKTSEQLKIEDVTVKDEIQSVKPGIMSTEEAASMDRAVVAENKRRNNAILRTIRGNASIVKACLDKSKVAQHGSKITLKWMIDSIGRVVMAEVSDSDFENPQVQTCVRDAAKKLDFSAAAIKQYKKSVVSYTYKVNIKSSRMPASVKKVTRKARPVKAK